MKTIKQLDDEINALTSAGKILEALDQYYSRDCSFQEGNQPPRMGRAADREFLEKFLGSLKKFNGATLHSQGVGTDVTLTEWTFDLEGPDGPILWNEILRRQWKDGKVTSERFYTAA
jgi:ketosteroid isomerase-like protein